MRKRLAKKREPVKRKKCVCVCGGVLGGHWEKVAAELRVGWRKEKVCGASCQTCSPPSLFTSLFVSLEINQFLRILDSERCFCWTVQAIVSKPRNCT